MYKIICFLLFSIFHIVVFAENNSDTECLLNQAHKNVKVQLLDNNLPYQNYISIEQSQKGYDIDLLNLYSANIDNLSLAFSTNSINDRATFTIENNSIFVGIDDTEKFSANLNFSQPYRYEQYSFFMLRDMHNIEYRNMANLFLKIKVQDLKIGVIANVNYHNDILNKFLVDPLNQSNIIYYKDKVKILDDLLAGKIDGFIGEHNIINHLLAQSRYQNKLEEISLNIEVPIYFGFTKDINVDIITQMNVNIENYKASAILEELNRKYIYPIILLRITDQQWFSILLNISIICFAISSVIVAAQFNANFFGTIILTLLPTIGGGVIRDLMIGIRPVTILTKYIYVYHTLAIAVFGFAILKIMQLREADQWTYNRLLYKITLICDFTGQAILTVVGVLIAAIHLTEPLILWGPFFAFVTSQGGGMLRDTVLKNKVSLPLVSSIQAELSAIWGIIFAIFLTNINSNTAICTINYAILFTIVGSLISGYLIYHYKLENIKFNDKTT